MEWRIPSHPFLNTHSWGCCFLFKEQGRCQHVFLRGGGQQASRARTVCTRLPALSLLLSPSSRFLQMVSKKKKSKQRRNKNKKKKKNETTDRYTHTKAKCFPVLFFFSLDRLVDSNTFSQNPTHCTTHGVVAFSNFLRSACL